MEITFTAEQESTLVRFAARIGCSPEAVVQELVGRFLGDGLYLDVLADATIGLARAEATDADPDPKQLFTAALALAEASHRFGLITDADYEKRVREHAEMARVMENERDEYDISDDDEDEPAGEFKIGTEFHYGGAHWRCTDVGSRVIVAICLSDHEDDPSWFKGPPYAVAEIVFDAYDITGCSDDDQEAKPAAE